MTDLLFALRVRLSEGTATVRAYDGGRARNGGDRIDVTVHHQGQCIFPLGSLWCGTPACGGMSVDGIRAKELVLSLVGMKPGDTDAEYFESYTPAQLEWAQRFGEEISAERSFRYCDPETGNVRE